MEPPSTPKLMHMSATYLPLDNTNKLLEIVYITLLGVIDAIILASAPILWWALSNQPAACPIPNSDKPPKDDFLTKAHFLAVTPAQAP
ncbi:hypothetical protein DSO57_1025225 [Entomophthora muscae]|uniref:Uncharacterized protein n=1 Tax=Entomophthora muscae TaxID=34485 RepID=A0ACC2RTF8_9FUNG|nr:hypothetical protein DSO57_1025225 [Entomophthora muscae]